MRNFFQHRFNELHLYCRLRDCGAPCTWAKWISSKLSAAYSDALYGGTAVNTMKQPYKTTGVVGGVVALVGMLVSLVAALSAAKGVPITLETQALIVFLAVSGMGIVAALIGHLEGRPGLVQVGESLMSSPVPSSAADITPVVSALEKMTETLLGALAAPCTPETAVVASEIPTPAPVSLEPPAATLQPEEGVK